MFLYSLLSPTPTTFDPVISFVSAVNLHLECPTSLLKGLADSHPDQEIWLNNFYEEKQGIESLSTFHKITLGEYCALHKKGAPKPIPTMCNLSPLNMTKTFFLLEQSLALLFLVTMRTAVGTSATGMSLCFGVTPSGFWSLWLCQSVIPSAKVAAKTPSARGPYLKTKSLLYGLHPAIPKCNQMSIGFSSTHSMVFVEVLVIGMTK
jgi:hypothetical protein